MPPAPEKRLITIGLARLLNVYPPPQSELSSI